MRHKLGLKTIKIAIRNTDCSVLDFLCRKRIEAEFRKIKITQGYSTHLLKLSKPMEESKLADIPGTYMILPDNYLWVATESCSACRIFSQLPVIVESVSYHDPLGIVAKIIIPGRLFQKELVKSLASNGLDVEVLSVKDYVDYELTERQREVLNTILKSGYLNHKRNVTIRDIAFLLGVDTSTVSRTFRAAIKKILLKNLE